ncbi:MAG: LysM domain-containing protein [Caldilineaceae bacterium]
MFTLYANHRGLRCGVFVGLIVLSLIIALLPSVALAAPPPPPGSMPPMGGMGPMGGYYTTHYLVHRGDTLSGIAAHFGVSLWALQQANGIRNPNRIYAGQWLCIPRGGGPGHPGGPGPHGPHH